MQKSDRAWGIAVLNIVSDQGTSPITINRCTTCFLFPSIEHSLEREERGRSPDVESNTTSTLKSGYAQHALPHTDTAGPCIRPPQGDPLPKSWLCTHVLTDPIIKEIGTHDALFKTPFPSVRRAPSMFTTMRENEELNLRRGRVLSYAIYGSPVPKTTVFYFHDFLSCGKEGKIWHTAASNLNIRLISADRPGMGDSSYDPDRTLLTWPKDIVALADSLKIQRFYVIGLGSGGPYALACVKEIPRERLVGAAVVSSLYPVSTETVHMPFFPRFLTSWVGPWAPGTLDLCIDMAMGNAARDSDPKVFDDWLFKEIECRPEVDRKVIGDEKNRWMFLQAARDSLKQGSQGLAWETRLIRTPWEFELEDLKVGVDGIPVTLWHGSEDTNCPPAMAKKAKRVMSGAELRMKDGEAHFSFAFSRQEEILGSLIGKSVVM